MLPYIVHPSEYETNHEKKVWQGRSSQLVNLPYFIFYSLIIIISVYFAAKIHPYFLIAGAFGIVSFIVKYLSIKASYFILTNERIIRHTGLFNKVTFEVELYRIKDVHLFEPFFARLFHVGNIKVFSSQRTVGIFMMPCINNCAEIRETIRRLVEKRKIEKGVSEFDNFQETTIR